MTQLETLLNSDNIFKFMCTLGAFMLVFAIVYPIEKKQQLELERKEVEKKVAILEIKVVYGILKLKKAEKDIDSSKASAQIKFNKYDTLIQASRDKQHQFDIDQKEIEFEKEKIKILRTHINEFWWWSLGMKFTGLFLFGFGGYKWYAKEVGALN
jgi:hypothetical protein